MSFYPQSSHSNFSNQQPNTMTDSQSHFCESVSEGPTQRSWERDSLKSEIPAEVLSDIGLVFASKEAWEQKDKQPSTSATSTSKKRSSQSSRNFIFSWPPRNPRKRRNPIVKTLLSAQGMFSTLYSLLNDVTGTHPLVSKILVDNCTIEVAYANDGFSENILLFGMKVESNGNILRLASASRVLSHLTSAILFRWGTFERAFSSGNEQAMDHLLCNTLTSLGDPKDFLFNKLPPFLHLTSPVKQRLDQSLYRFETSTFNSKKIPPDEMIAEAPKFLFHCLGSFLLHKGRLLASHLSAKLQQQLYSNTMTELNLWKKNVQWDSLSNLVLHTRAFLQLPGPNNKTTLQDCVAILVGTDYIMLGFILEPLFECAELTRHHTILWIHKALKTVQNLAEQDYIMRINQKPEQPVVSNMIPSSSSTSSTATSGGQEKKKKSKENEKKKKNTSVLAKLTKSKKNDKGMKQIPIEETKSKPSPSTPSNSSAVKEQIPAEETKLKPNSSTQPTPNSSSLKFVFTPTQPNASDDSGDDIRDHVYTLSSNNINIATEVIAANYQLAMNGQSIENSKSVETVEVEKEPSIRTSTTSSKGSSKRSSPKLVVGSRRSGSNSNLPKWKPVHNCADDDDDVIEKGTLFKPISIMKEKVLYHLVHFEFGRGYFLNSKDLAQELFYSQIMDNFQASARVSHGILQRAAKARTGLMQNTNGRKWLSHSLAPITEHGTMFQYWITKMEKKKEVKVKSIPFWVIGRLYDESKEIYFCYRDGEIQENMLESAFKLAHSVY